MKRWWIGAAVAAMCVGQSAWAQQPSGGGGPLPEPVPAAVCPPQPQFVPGPLTGAGAPPGPGDALSLPASLPTAWGKGPPPESGAYFHIGAMGLQRQRPGHGEIARRDIDDREALDTNDISPPFQWGPRFTFGYLYDDQALELTGFYLPNVTTAVSRSDLTVTSLSSFFNNLPGNFQGPDGLGLLARADSLSLSLQTALGDAELNYRWWSRAFTGFEGIFGFRYVDYQERARISGGRGILLADLATGITDRRREATYTVRAQNHMPMGQFGFEWTCPICSWLSAGVIAKTALGGDDVDVTKRLQRGDGITFSQGQHNHWTVSSLAEINAFFDIVQFDKVRLRAGYAVLWLIHVDEAFQQVDFNLADTAGQRNDNGSVFFHGPMIEVQILF
jgi:hypothetical protein